MSADSFEPPFAVVLDPYRRRLQRSAFVRYVPIGTMAMLAVTDIALVIFRPGVAVAILASGLAILLAMVGAIGLARYRGASLVETARAVDEHFALDNSAATALQFADASDPVSMLIVRKARARLAPLSPSRLRLGTTPSPAWVALTTVALSTLIVIFAASSSERESTPQTGLPTAASNAGRNAPSSLTPRGQRTGSEATRAATVEADGSAPSGLVPQTAEGRDAGIAARTETSETAGPSPKTPPAPRDGVESGASRVESLAAASSATAPGAAGDSQGSPSGTTPGAGRGRSGAGRGAGTTATRSAEAGGVFGGALSGSATISAVSAPPRASVQVVPLPVSNVAEAAVADQKVPFRLRSYVRAYFSAIDAPGGLR